MSEVFMAKDENGNKFAVKILQTKTKELRKRIGEMRNNLREGELAASFEHPNIVTPNE